jgi:hypothetical protein
MRARTPVIALVLLGLLALPPGAWAQQPPSTSAPLATELAKLLDARKLDAAAGRLGPDEFVGAMYFPGSQLVVLGAKTSVRDRMTYLLLQKSYKDLYVELNGTVDRQSRVFVTDLGANGLKFRNAKGEAPDSVEVGGASATLDGEWRKAKLSEADYSKNFQAHDDRYRRMLEALLTELKAQ